MGTLGDRDNIGLTNSIFFQNLNVTKRHYKNVFNGFMIFCKKKT